MFWKKLKEKHHEYKIESENLAVPEVHTGEVEQPEENDEPEEPITYENVAIPEIHMKRRREKKK